MISNATLKARELLFALGIDEPAQMSLEDLIIYHDGIVQEIPLSNCDGRMVMKNGKSIVSLNSNIEFPQKKRFVLAHELGHILLHGDKEATFSDDYSTLEAYKHGIQETEANDFATELLMPAELFQKACFKQKFGSELIRNLSDKFNTSLTSVIYRYVELGQHPICVFYSKDRKLQYWKKSKEFRYWIPDINKLNVPGDSVAEEYYSKGRIYTKKDSDQIITKSTWFELREYDADSPMFEFCVITPRYNTVLSVIWEK
jgi:Zn-dependent peptidase ImmA (M78 family)